MPFLALRVPDVAANHQRLVKENVFGLLRSNVMPLPILLSIAVVPIEPGAMIQRIVAFRHIISIR